MKAFSRLVVGVLLAASLPTLGVASVITMSAVPMQRKAVVAQADNLVRNYARATAALTYQTRQRRILEGRFNPRLQFSLPTVVRFQSDNSGAPRFKPMLNPGAGITLQFDSSGAEAFPSAYQTLLQNTFNSANSLLTTLFGPPSVGGTVHVANFDSSIGDRQAVAGGYYLPNNGSGVPEIRFPVYNANETAVVNFIHCLLLAYLGPDGYAWDGFEEGLVRAVTMKVARTPSALPTGLDQDVIESVLQNTYDIGAEYDWSNQRPLGGPVFIAPNLINSPLPPSGGGGPYLARFMMAGTAWAKVINEYPTFAAGLNAQVYATPSLGSNLGGLIAAGQTVMNGLSGTPTVEGRTFADWFQHQYVLNPTLLQGQKVLVQATPLTSTLTTGDFGVFIIEATYFSTDAAGNDTLLSGTSYPVIWDDTFNRVVTSAQDEQIQITASDGSVAPNIPDLFAGQPYRAAVDVPVQDKLQRVFLPAGAVATGSSSTVNDFYGTVEGMLLNSGQTARVDVMIGGTVIASAPVTNDAYGITIGTTSGYNGYATLTLNLVRTTSGVDSTVMTRVVDKTPGPIGVDLQVGAEGIYSFPVGLTGGISMIGMPVEPFLNDPGSIFNVQDVDLLMARYDSSSASYVLFPNTEPVTMGHGYFLNLPAAQNVFNVTGRFAPGVSTAVALKPGWNMISNPLREVISTQSVRVVHAADFPTTFADALGVTIGTNFFMFSPGTPDAGSGLPETGTYTAGSEFDPGIGYFILCLAPEGVVLEFDADNALSMIAPVAPPGYQLRVRATSNGRQSSAIIGETTGGGESYSVRVDSALPPVMVGGLQTYSVKGPALYKDMRAMNARHTFNVHVDGLVPGKNYVVDFSKISGNVRTFMVIDTGTGKIRTLFPGASWTINARGSSDTLVVVINK
jgi:hypothetical protein